MFGRLLKIYSVWCRSDSAGAVSSSLLPSAPAVGPVQALRAPAPSQDQYHCKSLLGSARDSARQSYPMDRQYPPPLPDDEDLSENGSTATGKRSRSETLEARLDRGVKRLRVSSMEEESPSSPSPSPTMPARALTPRRSTGLDDEEADPDFRQINSVLRNLHLERIQRRGPPPPPPEKPPPSAPRKAPRGRLSTDPSPRNLDS